LHLRGQRHLRLLDIQYFQFRVAVRAVEDFSDQQTLYAHFRLAFRTLCYLCHIRVLLLFVGGTAFAAPDWANKKRPSYSLIQAKDEERHSALVVPPSFVETPLLHISGKSAGTSTCVFLCPITGATGDFYSRPVVLGDFFSRLAGLFHDLWHAGFAASARSLHASMIVTRPLIAFCTIWLLEYPVRWDKGQTKTPLILQHLSVGKDEELRILSICHKRLNHRFSRAR
jgi:hypothetical protein